MYYRKPEIMRNKSNHFCGTTDMQREQEINPCFEAKLKVTLCSFFPMTF